MKGEDELDNTLQVRGLCKHYKGFRLQDVSFDVPAGTVTGLIGANGAGKTTTMRILLGLSRADGGSAEFFGTGRDASDAAVRARIGTVLDGGSFFDDLTIRQMTAMIAPAYREWSDTDYKRCMDMFALDPKKKIRTLSRGMRAKLALALALSHNADLLVMDEPTSGLDPVVRRELLDVLRSFLDDGERSVLLSTHITSDLDRIADSIVLMDSGRVLFQQNRDELLDAWRLVKGGSGQLTPDISPLLYDVRTTPFGFTAMTDKPAQLKELAPDVLLERPTIDDIMAAYVQEGDASPAAKGGRLA